MATDWFLEEYKLVQEKIDKVQSNQFQVRSWSVSVLTGFVLGIFATHLPIVVLIFAVPVIAMFHIQDWRQKWYREALSNRALQLESSINLLGLVIEEFPQARVARWSRMRQQSSHLGAVPGLGRTLIGEKQYGGWLIRRSESIFWGTQYGLVAVLVLGYVLIQAGAWVFRFVNLFFLW